jgi:CheY-like chemotaxis protein
MDGVTLAREIRQRTQTPLILLSSSGGTDHRRRCQTLSDPNPQTDQALLFVQCFAENNRDGTSTASAIRGEKTDNTMATRLPLRILLVEDNPVNQMVGLLMLSRLGYKPDLALDGQLALQAVEKVQ